MSTNAEGTAYNRTIPNNDPGSGSALTTGNSTIDLRPYAGKWIALKLSTGRATLRRFSGSAPTVVIEVGWTIDATQPPEEVWIDPNGDLDLRAVASATATLYILFDTQGRP